MPIVTISRGAKSGGIALAQLLCEDLGYRCLSREILVESAKKYNIDEETLAAELEKTPTFWQRLTKEQNRYLIFVKCALLQAAKDDNVVYHGHAGQFFLEGVKHALKVRILAPVEYRVRTVMADFGLTHDKAVEYIGRVDAARRRWVKALYGKDWEDPALYDLTINLAGVSLETACATIRRALESGDFAPTEESIQKLHDMSLECEIRAGIAADDKLWEQNLQVSAQSGKVVVRGPVKTQEQRDLVQELVSQVKGVEQAEVFVSLLSDPLPAERSKPHD
jgi:cytidylate kinase